ncbi:uncharacterized protein ARMOST_20593 [Armillaria ostoyae]|uniref:Uncharacterized protein n=1 Tax=Armillaria ostoyae TaxID=47428 RepID=A0A284S7Q9_ARMOS|nr:uncharacterized protein ARMOST_20593 [Armillaria ostoyae]
MRRLLSEHAELEKRTEELRGQLASVSRPTPSTLLPPEVLSEIFGLALGGDFFNVSDIKTGPWTFSYVCRSWRFAACGDPAIWTSILIDNRSVTVGASDKVSISYPRRDPASLLSAVLFRSNQRDINIVFNISGDDVDLPTKQTIRRMFQILMEESKRWKSASICVPPELIPMLDAVEGNVPRLSKLHIGLSDLGGYIDIDIPPVPLPLVAAFSVAPALKEVSFDGLGVDQVVDLPWSQMTSLTDICECVQSRTYAKILSLSPHLKILHLRYCREMYESPMIETNKFVNAELQSLTICSRLFLEKVEFPQLTRLTISPIYPILNMSDAIITMIASSRCRLQYLRIDHASLSVSFFEILASTPELTELELCCTRWNDTRQGFEDFVSRMDARTESGHYRVIPLLESLNVLVRGDSVGCKYRSLDSRFADMVASRCKHGALKSLVFEAQTDKVLGWLGQDGTMRLRTLKDEGFHISICTTSKDYPYTTGHWDPRFVQEEYRRIYV